MKKRSVALPVFILLAATGLGFAFPGHQGRGNCMVKEHFFKLAHAALVHAEDLGLSDAQVTKIRDLKMATKKEMIRKKADLDIVEIDLKGALKAAGYDEDAANDLVDQKTSVTNAKLKLLTGAIAALRGTLTAEQNEKLDTLRKEKWEARQGKEGREGKKHGMMMGGMKKSY